MASKNGIILLLFMVGTSLADPKPDHEIPKRPDKSTGVEHPVDEAEEESEGRGSACQVTSDNMARFANGESSQHKNLVTYLTTPACFNDKGIRAQALRYGIEFNKKLPLNFETLSQGALSPDSATRLQTESMLKQSVESLLRTFPMGQRDLLPFIGQLALLSPAAARSTLSTYILREISSVSQSRTGKAEYPPDLGKRLVELGAADSAVSAEISNSIEDMALATQATGLLDALKGLAAAAISEKSLSATYSAGVAALSRGIEKGENFYTAKENQEMQKVLFLALVAALPLLPDLPSTGTDYDNSFRVLIKDKSLKQTALNTVWIEVLNVLASQGSQTVLATALAKSLTPDVVYLAPQVRNQLFEVANHYSMFALPIQSKFLQALRTLARQIKKDPQKKEAVSEVRQKYFVPFFERIVELPPESIQPMWVQSSLEAGFFDDDSIEKHFPKYVLYQIKRMERNDLAAPLEVLSDQFGALWTLGQIEIPTLQQWVNRNEKK